jgi:hypothetical protein
MLKEPKTQARDEVVYRRSGTFRGKIKADEAVFGKGLFDSELEMYVGNDARQNHWLTLRLRVYLNFVDPASSSTKIVHQGGKDFVKDWDGWLFPLLPWTAAQQRPFCDGFAGRGERFWNARFYLKTPATYAELDLVGRRPNIMCLFRLELVKQTEAPHRTINVYNIDKTVTSVKNVDGRTKSISGQDSYTFRSDASNYDVWDTVKPAADVGTFEDRVCKCIVHVKHDTIAHELGHALGQPHIASLKGDHDCDIGAAKEGEDKCYDADPLNVMGRGERLDVLNAISWQKRMEEHTRVVWSSWAASMGYIAPAALRW